MFTVTLLACIFAAISWFDLLLGPTRDIYRLERISAGTANSDSVAFATEKLESHDLRVRNAAMLALGRAGPYAKASAPKLLDILAAGTPTEAPNAAWAIGNIGPTNSEASTALRNALTSNRPETRRYAAYAISRHGVTASAAIPELITALNDDHVSYVAARALGEMGPAGIVAIPELTELLSPSNGARSESATAISHLSAFTPIPGDTMHKLRALQSDTEDHVRKAASEAIATIESYTLDPESMISDAGR